MITGEYIIDCVIYRKDNHEDIGKANALLSDVSVNSSTDFYKLVLEVVEEKYDHEVLVRIVGVFKL